MPPETRHRVVIPVSIEAQTRSLLEAYGASNDAVTAVDFMAEGTLHSVTDTSTWDWRDHHMTCALNTVCYRRGGDQERHLWPARGRLCRHSVRG
jgi:cysteine synthase